MTNYNLKIISYLLIRREVNMYTMEKNIKNAKNAMIIGTLGIGAIAGYSMLRYAKNSRKPINRAKHFLSKANVFN